jgi:hypothetical protein
MVQALVVWGAEVRCGASIEGAQMKTNGNVVECWQVVAGPFDPPLVLSVVPGAAEEIVCFAGRSVCARAPDRVDACPCSPLPSAVP